MRRECRRRVARGKALHVRSLEQGLEGVRCGPRLVSGESVGVGGARRSRTGVSQDRCVLAGRTRLTGGTLAGGVWRSESGDGGSGIDSAVSIRGRSQKVGSAGRGGRGPRVYGVVRARMAVSWSRGVWGGPCGARRPRLRVCPRVQGQRSLTGRMFPGSQRSLLPGFYERGRCGRCLSLIHI